MRSARSIIADHDPEADTLELTQVYEWTPPDGGTLSRVTKVDLLHLLTAERLGELAHEAGFDRVDVWGDHLLTPYGRRKSPGHPCSTIGIVPR